MTFPLIVSDLKSYATAADLQDYLQRYASALDEIDVGAKLELSLVGGMVYGPLRD